MAKEIPEMIEHNVELLKDIGFTVTDVIPPASFGNFLVSLSSDNFRIRLILEKCQEFVDIAFDDNRKWIPISYIRKILYSEPPSFEYTYSFDKDTLFIKNNFLSIKELFSDKNIANTKALLLKRFNYS